VNWERFIRGKISFLFRRGDGKAILEREGWQETGQRSVMKPNVLPELGIYVID
jgi:hypothetical protein